MRAGSMVIRSKGTALTSFARILPRADPGDKCGCERRGARWQLHAEARRRGGEEDNGGGTAKSRAQTAIAEDGYQDFSCCRVYHGNGGVRFRRRGSDLSANGRNVAQARPGLKPAPHYDPPLARVAQASACGRFGERCDRLIPDSVLVKDVPRVVYMSILDTRLAECIGWSAETEAHAAGGCPVWKSDRARYFS